MRILALLWTVSLAGLCHGKGGHKNYRSNDNEHSGDSKKPQSIPANPQGSGNVVAEGSGTAEGSNCRQVDVDVRGSGDNLDAQPSLEDTEKEPTKPEKPASSLPSKVDTSLFNVVDSVEDNVKVLKLKAKEGVTANKLTYEGLTVWEEKKKSCLSAVLYLDKGGPTLAVIKAKSTKGDANFTVYRYHDGKKWKNCTKRTHKNKLKKLKESCNPANQAPKEHSKESLNPTTSTVAPPAEESPVTHNSVSSEHHEAKPEGAISQDNEEEPETPTAQPSQPAVQPTSLSDYKSKVDSTLFNVENGQENGFKVLKLKAKEGVTANKLTYGSEVVWQAQNAVDVQASDTQQLNSTGRANPNQGTLSEDLQQSTVSSALTATAQGGLPPDAPQSEVGEGTPKDNGTSKPVTDESQVPQPSGQSGLVLDLASPDEAEIVVKENKEYGVTVKYHYPKDTSKDTSKITTVMDGEKEVWKGVDKEHALSVLVYYAKGDSSLITIGISKGSGSKLDFKHFEKNADGKWTLIKKEDYDQKLKDLKSGVTNPSSSDPSTPS
ncbi:signal peptide containing protein [Theileria equi strain WA]|uniref:Signal peptide containing protein n=1 Tax=Theileria equi strain WA TaxID=1537102 RepID=L1LA51_THEEQ|nr:signal peptide containing protein [Theileria equi strain WA]EKX72110.1 signal peptide containing protein [Theileria equi strain WA]|eukprot:XP_004831562.1 signal peptide containing protein [Theileria equi strain WA]